MIHRIHSDNHNNSQHLQKKKQRRKDSDVYANKSYDIYKPPPYKYPGLNIHSKKEGDFQRTLSSETKIHCSGSDLLNSCQKISMDAKGADQEGSGSKIKKRPDTWKLPKIPVNQVYKKKSFRIFPSLHQNPSYVIKDFEKTITLDFTSQDNGCKSFKLIDKDFMDGFLKKEHHSVHWGLVQVAVKPLARDGLEAPIIVCLRDGRFLYLKHSVLAMVETDLSNGPFYFNCFPSYSIHYKDIFNCLVLALNAKTSGIPLAITYRIVCKAMSIIMCPKALKEFTLGKTTYFQGNSKIPVTTEWDEVQVPQEWTTTTRG